MRSLRIFSTACYVLKQRPIELMGSVFGWRQQQGAKKCSTVQANLFPVDDFGSRVEVLPYKVKAAQHYGAIRSVLEKTGQTIGVNDLHIAAHARSEGCVVVTNNISEFTRVPGLKNENWVAHQT